MTIIKNYFNINIKSVMNELIGNALDASKILHGGEIRERYWELHASEKLIKKFFNKTTKNFEIEKDEYHGWVTINGIKLLISEFNLPKNGMYITEGYTTISEIIFLKPFRLYKIYWGLPTMWNFNHNNDVIPWIQSKFNKLKNRIFGIEVIDNPTFLQEHFYDYHNYEIYKDGDYPIIQIVEFIPNGKIRKVYRVNYNNLIGFIKKSYDESWNNLVKGHKEAKTWIPFGEHNLDRIKELCFDKRKI